MPPLEAFRVDLVIVNLGNTPAQVSGSLLQVSAIELTPDEPPYNEDLRSESAYWLLKGDSVVRHADGGFNEYEAEWIGDSRRRFRVYVFGYVDYMDRFGRRHRHGFGRRYDPSDTNYNLRFVPEAGYNYDRERKPGEGNDWDEPTQ
ncbi:MAG: hypothetical protein AB7H88_22225 [Vicinamibacterales bacterium]